MTPSPSLILEDAVEKVMSLFPKSFTVYSFYATLLLAVSFLIVLAIISLLLNRLRLLRKKQRTEDYTNYILEDMLTLSDTENIRYLKKHWRGVLYRYSEVSQSLHLDHIFFEKIQALFCHPSLVSKVLSGVRSRSRYRRIESAMLMENLRNAPYRLALENLLTEKNPYFVKLYAVNSLIKHNASESFPLLVESLIGAPGNYREMVCSLMGELGNAFHEYIPEILDRNEPEICELLIVFSETYVSESLEKYLLKQLKGSNAKLTCLAAAALRKNYPFTLLQDEFLNSENLHIRKEALWSLANRTDRDSLQRLLELIDDPHVSQTVIHAISQMSRRQPLFIPILIKYFNDTKNEDKRTGTARVLANHLDYLLMKLLSPEKKQIRSLLQEFLKIGIFRELIGFLNKNKNLAIETEIVSILEKALPSNPLLKEELCAYLAPRILEQLNLKELPREKKRRAEKTERGKTIILIISLFVLLGIVPAVYMVRYRNFLTTWEFETHLKQFVIDFNYYLAYYSTSINLIYLILLFFSILGLRKQVMGWRAKQKSFLYKSRILPSISIIAPAYCEEANIIESTNSLLNLNYPNYELIVVNDGSTDDTLNRLIEYYQLERVDYETEHPLPTMPILGVYKSVSQPGLTVVDKINGGKADSLNVGINMSTKDYFCGIDADSLLEPDALLKVISQLIDSDEESVALGGNIFPINGCDIEKGMLTRTALPENWLGKFQTIEYLRAFMAGRIGWSQIKCLLIISGAFGVFKKDRIIEVGGYLTAQGRYEKDTVGEDMELVVRLSRHMREQKHPFGVHYAYNANCWTEVPESLKILSNQRNRWHRGLIDILYFHWKIFFRPSFGRMGWIPFPYFLMFEVFGPLLEVQGYLMVILAASLGLLNKEILLILFTATIMLGILISVSSLLIAEKEQQYYSLKDSLKLLLFAVIENFGFRQYVSFERVFGYFSAMKSTGGWGKMVRKGFSSNNR